MRQAQVKVNVSNLKEDIGKLKSQIVESPDELKSQLEKMRENIKTTKMSIVSLERQLKDGDLMFQVIHATSPVASQVSNNFQFFGGFFRSYSSGRNGQLHGGAAEHGAERGSRRSRDPANAQPAAGPGERLQRLQAAAREGSFKHTVNLGSSHHLASSSSSSHTS